MAKRGLSAATVPDDSDNEAPVSKKAKNGKAASKGAAGKKGDAKAQKTKNDAGEFWELSNNRRLAISSFKGKTMIDIREYYSQDGDMKPGKKGISLPLPQFSTLLSHLPEIESALAAQGEKIERPKYKGARPTAGADEEEEQGEADEDEEGGGGGGGGRREDEQEEQEDDDDDD